MTIIPIYKNKIINIPYEIVTEKLSSTTNDELKVLIAVLSKQSFEVNDIAEMLDITANSVKRALNKWQDAGVFVIDNLDETEKTKDNKKAKTTTEKKSVDAQPEKQPTVNVHTAIATYTTSELSDILQQKEEYKELVNSCQQTLGKIFNYQEISIIIGLREQLALTNDFILLLCSYSVSIDKKSVRYIEKIAFEFYERDIKTYSDLEDELSRIKVRKTYESFIRTLFGIGKRQFTSKEKDMITRWKETYTFSDEMIQAAYELTVTAINEANINYTNSILENWYAKNIKNQEDLQKEQENYKDSKNKIQNLGNSYNTDSFFDKVLMESYKDDK